MKPQEESQISNNNNNNNKRFKNEAYPLLYNKSRIYNLEYRKKPAELVRKDLISAMKLPDHELLNRDDYCIITDPWREEWEKGVQVPVNPNALPHSIIKNNDKSSSSLSSNNNDLFILPKELIKSDPSINDHKSSYELDLQDVCWLQSLKASELNLFLSQNFLEFIINKFEQQCAENIKSKQMGIEYDEQIVCDVCQSPDGEEGNEMVFCDSCNICVHQACYGIQEIPDGDWLCKPCKDLGSHKKNALCLLCPNVGGALKPTTKTNKWAHVSCVYWIPEAKFLNLDYLEPVEIKSIPNWRWNLVCSLCNIKKGAPIICDEKNCRHSYHVTCAFKHKLKMKIVLSDDKSNIRLKSYCVKHSQQICQQNTKEPKNKNNKEIDFFDVPDNNNSNNNNNNGNQNQDKLNSCCEFWKYVDKNQIFQDILNNEDKEILEIRKNVNANQLNDIIDLIYQYWKLKRLSNYGNSLIKLTFAEKFKEQVNSRKNQMRSLRYHLERLRTLSYMLCRREKIKQNYIQTQKEILENTLKFVDDEIEKSSRLTNEHTKLFSSIINHHSLYSIKDYNQNNTLNMDNDGTTQNNNNNNNDNLILMKEDSASSSSTATSSTTAATNVSLSHTPGRRGRKTRSENSFTNRLIREVKRLKKIQQSRNNPYARVYLNQTKSRKSLPNNLGNDDDDDDTNENVKVDPKLIQHIEENNRSNTKISSDDSSSSLLHLKPLSHNNNSKIPIPPTTVRRVNTIDNYFKKIDSPIIKINKNIIKMEGTKDSSISQKENDNSNHLNSNSNNRKSTDKLPSLRTKKRKNSIHFQKSIVPSYTLPTASNQHNNKNNDNDDNNALYKINGKYLKIQTGQIKLLSPSAAKKNKTKNNLHISHHNHKHRQHHYKYNGISNNHKTFNNDGSVCKNKIKYSLRNKV